jgi:AAA15 family ATPase/GTPase
MLKRLHISNYKSIYDETIELGRFNVFIGENGSGKTNALEALGMASAASENKLSNDELALKGIRVAKPTITFSSFLGEQQKDEILIEYEDENHNEPILITNIFSNNNAKDIFSKWKLKYKIFNKSKGESINYEDSFLPLFDKMKNDVDDNLKSEILDFTAILKEMEVGFLKQSLIKNFKIYNLSTQTLRGIGGTSRAIPGIQGENLDRLIESFNEEERAKLEAYAYFISWLDKIEIDSEDSHKRNGHKLDRSTSVLYFRDKFMQKKNNLFSAENANEGVLHILFYLALFISKHTSKLLGIDNIETALNPELCRKLTEQLVKLSKENDRQVLITTHSPSALDGLDLHDDEQRLFKVYRNRKGHTKVKRIQLKPDQKLNGEGLKLSELWMRNYIGAIPQNL